MTKPAKYRKRPVVIEALQFTGTNLQEKLAWEKFDKYGWETSYGEMATKLRSLTEENKRLREALTLIDVTMAPPSTAWSPQEDRQWRAREFQAFKDIAKQALSPIDPPLVQGEKE